MIYLLFILDAIDFTAICFPFTSILLASRSGIQKQRQFIANRIS